MNATQKTNKTATINWQIIIRLMIVFCFVFAVASCKFFSKEQPQLNLSKLQLKEDIISFTFKKAPKIYSGLIRLDNEIVLIDNELERLKEIENEFPRQIRIIIVERGNWKKVKNELLASFASLKREVEKIYVTHLVNKEKGSKLIGKNMKSLVETVNKALESSSAHTKRLIAKEKKSFLASLKNKILG